MSDVDGVSVRTLRLVVAEVERQGDDADAVLAKVGLGRSQLANVDARVPHELAVRCWLAAQSVTADPFFGLNVATHQDPRGLDLQAYAMFSSPTLGEGLRRVVDVHRLQHSRATLELERSADGGTAILRHRLPGERRLPRCIGEWIVATWLRAIREATGQRLDVSGVDFAHAAPSSPRQLDELRDTFGVTPTFGASRHELRFSAGYLSLAMADADPRLLAILDRHAQALIDALPAGDDLTDRVRSVLVHELGQGDSGAERVADRLHMSVSTLGRRLREQGSSYKALLAEVRHEMASRYLADESMAITDVAFLLGFSETSALTRAFKRWTGLTPTQWRDRQRQPT